MSFTVAIDISTFFWCEEDFKRNKSKYISLKSLVPDVYTQIKELKSQILFRYDLEQLIWTEFPYKMIEDKEIGYDFQRLTLEFLIDTFSNWTLYTDNNDNTITSAPELKKLHFSKSVEIETQSQVCHLYHNNHNTEHKYIAYSYLYNNNTNLILKRQSDSVGVDTLRYNSKEEIMAFFDKQKIKFRHNPKHNRYKSGGKVSPLSCYNERIGDITKAQELLEKAYKLDEDYYYLDEENDVYVQFVSSNDGTFHGFDISDEKGNVPSKIKSKFNKNGRVF